MASALSSRKFAPALFFVLCEVWWLKLEVNGWATPPATKEIELLAQDLSARNRNLLNLGHVSAVCLTQEIKK
jgi:hypothetical protein